MRLIRPVSILAPVAGITHGSQINPSNTGYTAYYDPSLGRNLTISDLATVSGPSRPSDFVSAGGTITKKRFLSDVRIDIPNVTFRGCLFESFASSYLNGVETYPSYFEWCSWDPPVGAGVGDLAVGTTGTNLYRCYVRGFADATWINGQPGGAYQTFTESCLRVKMASGVDHNDGAQCSGGTGNVRIQRCNIDMNPEGGILSGGGGPNACVFAADLTGTTQFHLEVIDCWLDGSISAEAVRFYDGALTPNITYVATGNRIVRRSGAAMGRGTANTTPTSQVTWVNNVWDDDGSTIPLS